MYEAGLVPRPSVPLSEEESEETESVYFPSGVSELFEQRGWDLITDKNAVYRNTGLRIAGRPDGIDHAGDAMIPIEIMIRNPSSDEDDIEYRPPKIGWLHR